ncbi:hypothetical protein D3C75_1285200 [compost metagenome]
MGRAVDNRIGTELPDYFDALIRVGNVHLLTIARQHLISTLVKKLYHILAQLSRCTGNQHFHRH